MAKAPALLCNSCGFGSKMDDCIKCGKNFAKIMVFLYNSCGFGSKAKKCIKCGKNT